jgi:hypothetical protein
MLGIGNWNMLKSLRISSIILESAKLLGTLESAIRWEKTNSEWYPNWRSDFLE